MYPPSPLAPKPRRRWLWIGLGALLLIGVIATIVDPPQTGPTGAPVPATSAPPHNAPPPSVGAAPPSVGGAAAGLLGEAGPLHAHVENTSQVICDSSTATVMKTSAGFRVTFRYPGPAVVTASVMSFDDQTGQQHATLGGNELGHTFTFTEFPLSQAETITVGEMSAVGAGTCDVVNRTQS